MSTSSRWKRRFLANGPVRRHNQNVMRIRLASLTVLTCLLFACGNGAPFKGTTSDKNYDDPDDPGSVGQNDPRKDGAVVDAAGRFCLADRNCPADFRCVYPIAGGCAAAGACEPFVKDTCAAQTGCGCDGVTVTYCLPAGSAPKPLKSTSACGGFDAATDAADGATDGAASDAPPD